MKLSEKQRKFTRDAACFIEFCYGKGIELTLGEAHRTQDQALLNFYGFNVVYDNVKGLHLVKRGRTSWTLSSLHMDRLSIDFNFFKDGKLVAAEKEENFPMLKELGDYWCSLDPKNRWGGDWDMDGVYKKNSYDPWHIERRK